MPRCENASGTQGIVEAEVEIGYPDPGMFGDLPATGVFARHVKKMDVSDVQVKTLNADARPAFWLRDVEGADLFRIRVPDDGAQAFSLSNVKGIRCLGSAQIHDQAFESAVSLSI